MGRKQGAKRRQYNCGFLQSPEANGRPALDLKGLSKGDGYADHTNSPEPDPPITLKQDLEGTQKPDQASTPKQDLISNSKPVEQPSIPVLDPVRTPRSDATSVKPDSEPSLGSSVQPHRHSLGKIGEDEPSAGPGAEEGEKQEQASETVATPQPVSITTSQSASTAKPQPVSVAKTQPISEGLTPVSTQGPESSSPTAKPRWTGRRPLSADLTSKFESVALQVPRRSGLGGSRGGTPQRGGKQSAGSAERTESERRVELPAPKCQPTPAVTEGGREMEEKEKEDEESGGSIKRRISRLFESSSASPGGCAPAPGVDPHSSAQPVSEKDISVGVKQRIKLLTADTPPSQPTSQRIAFKPRPLSQDLTKCFEAVRPEPACLPSIPSGLEREETRGDPENSSKDHGKPEDSTSGVCEQTKAGGENGQGVLQALPDQSDERLDCKAQVVPSDVKFEPDQEVQFGNTVETSSKEGRDKGGSEGVCMRSPSPTQKECRASSPDPTSWSECHPVTPQEDKATTLHGSPHPAVDFEDERLTLTIGQGDTPEATRADTAPLEKQDPGCLKVGALQSLRPDVETVGVENQGHTEMKEEGESFKQAQLELEAERQREIERERVEKEREMKEKERVEKERAEREKVERERAEREKKMERERMERERVEREREMERERMEMEREMREKGWRGRERWRGRDWRGRARWREKGWRGRDWRGRERWREKGWRGRDWRGRERWKEREKGQRGNDKQGRRRLKKKGREKRLRGRDWRGRERERERMERERMEKEREAERERERAERERLEREKEMEAEREQEKIERERERESKMERESMAKETEVEVEEERAQRERQGGRQTEVEKEQQMELERENEVGSEKEDPKDLLPSKLSKPVPQGEDGKGTGHEEVQFDDFSVKPTTWGRWGKVSWSQGTSAAAESGSSPSPDTPGGEGEGKKEEGKTEVGEPEERREEAVETPGEACLPCGGQDSEQTLVSDPSSAQLKLTPPSEGAQGETPPEPSLRQEEGPSEPSQSPAQDDPREQNLETGDGGFTIQTEKQSKSREGEERQEEAQDDLAQETHSHTGICDTEVQADDSLTPITPDPEDILNASPTDSTPPHTTEEPATPGDLDAPDTIDSTLCLEPEPLPFPEISTSLLDSSMHLSRAELGRKRGRRSQPSWPVRHSVGPDSGLEDWKFRDSTEEKLESAEQQDSDSEEKPMGTDPRPPSYQPQMVLLFPGIDPSKLKAVLQKRGGDSDGQADSPTPSPSQLSRSPKSPFPPGAQRVLPPAAGTEDRAESSPQWLQELKSKKRRSLYGADS
ncbi:hypothetical protein MATL_G00086090 [Megalops atlanticus]|uniref:Tankyrase 1-binding protein C-terminal domain-containing protein n=1 Tax=Megalops atlanticus TaxID=7932 RepID=A0A9D3T859_MEGAT|nr:hypothetical protein MATL_G00086090 [Megalops atlanticus]